jgi:hypothetical protein
MVRAYPGDHRRIMELADSVPGLSVAEALHRLLITAKKVPVKLTEVTIKPKGGHEDVK